MDVFTLRAVLGLDTKEYDDKLDSAKGKLGTALGNAAKVGAAAVGAASVAVVAFGKSAVDAGAQFDSSMSQVAATMGKSVDEIGQLRDFAQEMGATTAFSATEAADALNYMALAGYDADTSMAMLPNVLNLAAAGNIELASASDMVTDAQSALGLSLDETSDMVNQMAMASSKSNTSVAQLGEAFLTIGATARNLSGGTVELSTVLGVLADNGIKGAEGGTHLRNAILSLQTPTKDGTEALKKLGMSYADMYDAAGNMKSLPQIFQTLSNKMKGMNQQSKDAIISGLFNKADLASVNALLGTSAERWDELAGFIGDAGDAADVMAKTQLDNLNGDVTLFKSALEGVKIAISDKITPSLREFVQFGSDGLSRLTKAFKEEGLGGAMTVFGDLLSQGINMIVQKLPEVIQAGTQVITALLQGIIQNIPQLVEAAVQIITILVTALGQNAPLLIDGAIQLVTALGKALLDNAPQLMEAAADLVNALIDGIKQCFSLVSESGGETIIEFITGIVGKIPDVIDSANEIVNEFLGKVKEKLPELLQRGVEMIVNLVTGILQELPDIIDSAGQIFNTFLQFIIDNFPTILSAGIDLIVNLCSGIIKSIPNVLGATIQVVTTILKTIVDNLPKILEKGKEIVNKIIEGIKSLFNDLANAGREIIDTVKDAIGKKIGEAVQWGKDLVTNFIDGIRSNFGPLFDVLDEMGEAVESTIGFSEPDRGPLSHFHEYAPDMVDLFVKGIRENAYKIPEAFDEALGLDEFAMPNTGESDGRYYINITQNIYSEAQTAAELMREARWEQERAVLTGV